MLFFLLVGFVLLGWFVGLVVVLWVLFVFEFFRCWFWGWYMVGFVGFVVGC